MKEALIKGQNYNFLAKTNGNEFYIRASHIASGRYSFINNLNPVLSMFRVCQNDKRVEESQWFLPTERMAISCYKEAIDLLSEIRFLHYLEKILDEDRRLGEWENIKRVR